MNQQFGDFMYQRPDLSVLKDELRHLTKRFAAASSAAVQGELLHEINQQRNEFASMASLAHIRHTINTKDPYYAAEQDYFDEVEPLYNELNTEYYRTLVSSSFKKELSLRFGQQLFSIAEMTLQTFSPAVIAELQQENKLVSRYKQLLASASIPFAGAERNLSQLVPYQQSVDRGTRQAAAEARYGFFAEHSEEFDHYYDELVRLRTTIAHKLGFPTFTPLGYLRCHRSDYQPDMVDSFRKEVEHHIVPLASMLREEQRARLGLDQLFYYDENLFYPQGNPLPTGTPEEMIQAARRMYAQLSEESGTFFDEMDQRKLMDLLSRAGKAPGGYCDYLASFRAPFIFANFNGTSGDVDVLTHEAGHAFQVWLCQEKQIPEYQFATMDAAEIPSMAMEFFTWPWMEQFFAEQASRYRYEHLVSSLTFLPYGCLVDHFQHQVYAEPTLTPQKRRHIWRHLEERYLPHRNYNGQPFLEDGGFWFQQGHIYEVPFYYIDYVLAQSCVFQLWQRAGIDRESAWQDYLTLCRAGGSQSFTNLLPLAKVASPFAQGTMAAVAESVTTWLNNPDNQPK